MTANPVMRVVRRRAGVVLRATHLWPTTRVRTRRLASTQDRLREDVATLKAAMKEARATAKANEKRIASLEALLPGLELLIGRRLPGMNRAIAQDVLDTLIKEVGSITEAKRADHHVATGYATLFELEARGLGRIAGTTQNVVGKLTTTPLLNPPNDEILEIGTLFGMHAAGLARQFARHGRTAMLTIIDPLDGLQLQGGRNDQVDRTTVPVVEDVVRLNFTLAGFPDHQLRIIKGFSQDPDIRAAAADRRYGTIVVDGDHSAEGVARDLLWAEDVTADGGVIVLDDYGDPKWPGVQEAVDAHLKGSTRFSMIGTVATSAYLRAAQPSAQPSAPHQHSHQHREKGVTSSVSGMTPTPEALEAEQVPMVMRARRRVGKRIRWVGARVMGMPKVSGRMPPKARYDDYTFTRELATNPVFTWKPGDPTPAAIKDALDAPEILRGVDISNAGLRLSIAEVEAIRAYGIVRMIPEPILTYSPPSPSIAFATVTNDKYAPGVEALLLSLLRLYPQLTSDFIVFHDEGLSQFSMDRMNRLYAHMRFEHRSTGRYDIGQIGGSDNHKRVGLLGYLSVDALTLDEYDRVVVLDADTVVLKDISRVWASDKICVVPDAGALPFGLITRATGRPVINSGMISLPKSELGQARWDEAMTHLHRVNEVTDPMLDRFADQKFWNIYLATRDVELAPLNYNCNKWLVDNYFPEIVKDVAVLHITGAKPWYDFADRDLVTELDIENFKLLRKRSPVTLAEWNDTYFPAIAGKRISGFRADCGPELEVMRGSRSDRPAVLIGNGPSLKQTDLAQFDGFEKFVFNWFVHHDDFDTVAPDHLVLASHMFFGGWHTATPSIPPSWLAALATHTHRPRIWTSYYFKDLIERTPELAGYDVSYFLFEKPFKQNVTRMGHVGLDLLLPLTDAHTGVLTAGVPIGLHLGCTSLVLVGCDADYSSAAGSYFYDAAKHASKTTNESHLVGTWTAEGTGQYAYSRVAQAVSDRGVKLLDSTVGGKLTVLEKIALRDVRSLLPMSSASSAS